MITILYIFGIMTVVAIVFLTYAIMTEPYPEELEQEDNERITKMFDEHKKKPRIILAFSYGANSTLKFVPPNL